MYKNIISIVLFTCILVSCNSSSRNQEAQEDTGKPKYLWFDAEANFERFSHKDSIVYYLDKTKETGFNRIVVDVRPVQGDVLYKSDFMAPLTEIAGHVVHRDWDYLQFFIDEAKKRNLKVTVSTTIFTAGLPEVKQGMVYRDNKWDGKTCLQYTKDKGLLDIKDDKSRVGAFLNPVLPESQEFALSFIKEIVSKYDFEGYALDYCRYPSPESDFSEATRIEFEKYIGEKVPNFPEDIYTWNADGSKKAGKYFKQWWEFRAMVIHNFIKKVKEEIKQIKPDIKLEYWAASWINGIYGQGQNWASKSYDPSQDPANTWASPNYKNTGFAEHLDVFMCGAYLERVYGKDDNESQEYAYERGKRIIDGKTTMVGSIYALEDRILDDAVYESLMQTEGLVVFDIVQVIEKNQWDRIKKSIDRAEGKIGSQEESKK